MKNYAYVKKAIVSSVFGLVILAGTALITSAQNVNEQYRQWQRAQARAEQRHQEYLMTGRASDYRQWQNAQIKAQREWADYQRSAQGYNRGYNTTGYYNNGYYNNGYSNNGYYNNTTGNVYRVYRNGSYYTTDSRGAELLRRAVQNGYSQGYRQGQIDRRYGRGFSYYDDNTYRSGTYGWQSYVERNQYQYYFQQGFQRGYEDGYQNTYRYGVRSSNGFNILSSVLNTILSFTNR